MLHRQRPEFSSNHPLHVTFRVRSGLPTLRRPRFHRVFRQSLAQLTAQRQGFRVVHYAVQRDHVHCLVEAEGKQALSNGMKSLGARFSRAVNRVLGRLVSGLEVRCLSVAGQHVIRAPVLLEIAEREERRTRTARCETGVPSPGCGSRGRHRPHGPRMPKTTWVPLYSGRNSFSRRKKRNA